MAYRVDLNGEAGRCAGEGCGKPLLELVRTVTLEARREDGSIPFRLVLCLECYLNLLKLARLGGPSLCFSRGPLAVEG